MKNEKLKNAREKRGMSQCELADAAGVSRYTINKIENGNTNPKITLCLAICKALKLKLNDLFWE